VDLASLLGIFSGIFLIFWAIASRGSLTSFLEFSSFLIVIGGTTAAVLLNYPLSQVLQVLRVLKQVFTTKTPEPRWLVDTITELARIARREGLLLLEDEVENLDHDFLRRAIQLVVDGTDDRRLREILETEIQNTEQRHQAGQGIFRVAGSLAPAFGMIGTLIGLIQMLADLDSPDKIGSGMAVALITTFYGALMANLVFIPIAGKLRIRSEHEVYIKEMILAGVLSIQAGDNPRAVEQKLMAYLGPKERDRPAEPASLGAEGLASSDEPA